jgi:hypothetical protein
MQSSLSPVAAYIVEIVLKNAMGERTGAQKLQLIGVLTVIVMLQRRGDIPTSRSVALFLDADPTVIGRNILWLEKKGIITREKVLNVQGRGHAYKISLTETDELRELLGLKPQLAN